MPTMSDSILNSLEEAAAEEAAEEVDDNNHLPLILQNIALYLKAQTIKISEKIEGEGRGGSLKDEGTIKRTLLDSPYKKYIIDVKPRGFGDMLVLDYNETDIHVVNIKTSIGSTDNCFSKRGFVYALTSLTYNEIPKQMNFIEMYDLLIKYKKDIPNKDYWFLCIDKNNSESIMIRGAKQINNWVVNINPSNIAQVNWAKEKKCKPCIRNYEEVYEVLIGGIIKSLNSFWANIPSDWKN